MEIGFLLFSYLLLRITLSSVMRKNHIFVFPNTETRFFCSTAKIHILVIKKISLIKTTKKIEILLSQSERRPTGP